MVKLVLFLHHVCRMWKAQLDFLPQSEEVNVVVYPLVNMLLQRKI